MTWTAEEANAGLVSNFFESILVPSTHIQLRSAFVNIETHSNAHPSIQGSTSTSKAILNGY